MRKVASSDQNQHTKSGEGEMRITYSSRMPRLEVGLLESILLTNPGWNYIKRICSDCWANLVIDSDFQGYTGHQASPVPLH
jgi:hypothetical protein